MQGVKANTEKLTPEEKRRRNAARCKAYHAAHREEHKARCKAKYYADPDAARALALEWYRNNKEAHKARVKVWVGNNREKLREAKAKWQREYVKNPSVRIARSLRERVRFCMVKAGSVKSAKTEKLLGCSFEFFRGWIESKFRDGMNWGNYGRWHIDHIRPCSSFDLTKESEQNACFHYTNMQPLWALENFIKSNKIQN